MIAFILAGSTFLSLAMGSLDYLEINMDSKHEPFTLCFDFSVNGLYHTGNVSMEFRLLY